MNNLLKNKALVKFLIFPFWKIMDRLFTKDKTIWIFPVHFSDHTKFIENTRAVFEFVKQDPRIKKVIFTRNKYTDFAIEDAVNTEFVDIQSTEALAYLWKAKVIFLANAISWDLTFRWNKDTEFLILKMNLKRRTVVNLWHGIPLKKILNLWNPELRKRYNRIAYRAYERENYAIIPASSAIDAHVMANVFEPISFHQVFPTGLPRNDFLLQKEINLPSYITSQLHAIRAKVKAKKLILYAPTHRQTSLVEGSGYYEFSENETKQLRELLEANNAVLGIRMHYLRKGIEQLPAEKLIDNELIIDVGNTLVPEIAPLIREAHAVITDYSSLYMDALYLNKPVFSFAYDYEHYKNHQDGMVYDMELAFPGPVVTTFESLLEHLSHELKTDNQVKSDKYQMTKKIFFDHIDTHNTQRLVEVINQ
ncbi:MAG: CDP-glycerol glycerophosphotransferase family protein [Cyclobacteriaceae bacterium]|nr:CDP-glycerol glycerophosphotransferase family protein [Cyclobacteriaceae bacterium]